MKTPIIFDPENAGVCSYPGYGLLDCDESSLGVTVHTAKSRGLTGTEQIEDAKSIAKRIVSCVNACAGLNPEAVPELVAACKAQHEAIDRLFSMLIEAKKDFFPSKSGQPWEAMQLGVKALSNSTI